MRNLGPCFFLCAALPAFAQTPPLNAAPADPAKVLLDFATKDEAAGRLEKAKLVLLTLASTYNVSLEATVARTEVGAIYMFWEAQAQAQSGKNQAAYDAYRTVVRVYPDSPLAKVADDASRSLGIPPKPRR